MSGLHIAVIAPPTPGHLNPLQALGLSLQKLGHRVTVVHLDEARRFVIDDRIGFAALANGSGRGLLDTYLARLAHPSGAIGLNRMIVATAAMSALLLDELPSALERIGADAVVADAAEPAGALVADHLGLPCVVSVTGLPLLREAAVPPPFLGWSYRPGRIGRLRNGGGYAVSDLLMRPITRVLATRQRRWGVAAVSPALQIAQCPQALDFPRQALPASFRYGAPWRDAEPAGEALPVDGQPLVFCSLGTLQGGRKALFASMTAACAAIGARAVVGHGGGLSDADAAALPGDPLVRAFWPQAQVLRQCAAAVLHGGFNTVLDALAAGVPIVALPIGFEQPATAARLRHVGAGKVLSPKRLEVAALAAALREVIDQPTYRAAARDIGAEMAQYGGAARAAEMISESLTATVPSHF